MEGGAREDSNAKASRIEVRAVIATTRPAATCANARAACTGDAACVGLTARQQSCEQQAFERISACWELI